MRSSAGCAEFPDVPHRYCDNHFLRDVAQPVLDADSHTKVQMRKKVRGLRKVEQAVLEHQRESTAENPAAVAGSPAAADPEATVTVFAAADSDPGDQDSAGDVVLDYCTAVRGILNDDQGGPLDPPGLRMADALQEVGASIQRNLDEKKGGSRKGNSAACSDASSAVWTKSRSNKRSSETTSRSSRRWLRPSKLGPKIAPSVRRSSRS